MNTTNVLIFTEFVFLPLFHVQVSFLYDGLHIIILKSDPTVVLSAICLCVSQEDNFRYFLLRQFDDLDCLGRTAIALFEVRFIPALDFNLDAG